MSFDKIYLLNRISRLFMAACLLGLLSICLLFNIAYAAVDSDDDGVLDSSDNCVYVSNADQRDNVSAFILGHGDKWKTSYEPLWAPLDKSTTRVYVGGIINVSGTDYTWSSDGTKIEFTTAPKLDDEVRLVVLEDKDGRGDKCSPDLTVDFDGIPDEGDNCPLVYNPYQEDTWGTSEGDVCETGSGISEIHQVWAKMYEHSNYHGIEEVIRVDDVLLSGNAIGDDAVSSIRVGPHTAVYLYSLPNYGGESEFFGSDDSDFMDNQIGHDTVSSIRMYSTAPIKVTKIDAGIDFWSGTKGHVGHISTSQLQSLVSGGSGVSITLEHDYVDSVQSITVDYNGTGDYVVSTKNLDGTLDETANFHYEGVAEVATTAVVTATSTPVPTPVLAEESGNKYIVQSGDYLFKIAVLHNTSVQALVLANNIANSDLVFEGQVLILP
ncbi:MAG TPA: LysM peptidoglycan-binding domain-containing protein [Anaerolineales bacterium]|nr:LysM peptidoglycan-binding domain-containing protein [Anaerolineales bacterium]